MGSRRRSSGVISEARNSPRDSVLLFFQEFGTPQTVKTRFLPFSKAPSVPALAISWPHSFSNSLKIPSHPLSLEDRQAPPSLLGQHSRDPPFFARRAEATQGSSRPSAKPSPLRQPPARAQPSLGLPVVFVSHPADQSPVSGLASFASHPSDKARVEPEQPRSPCACPSLTAAFSFLQQNRRQIQCSSLLYEISILSETHRAEVWRPEEVQRRVDVRRKSDDGQESNDGRKFGDEAGVL
ncbi:hypothetical protein M5K25_010363 [Dendrobium thyrsiflorum]|uniref:Uncharacterized protein n=1 Tax=Dendrobium thyrsiflorum TaxID=117978 RepID=A0ABD0V700_DENTH